MGFSLRDSWSIGLIGAPWAFSYWMSTHSNWLFWMTLLYSIAFVVCAAIGIAICRLLYLRSKLQRVHALGNTALDELRQMSSLRTQTLDIYGRTSIFLLVMFVCGAIAITPCLRADSLSEKRFSSGNVYYFDAFNKQWAVARANESAFRNKPWQHSYFSLRSKERWEKTETISLSSEDETRSTRFRVQVVFSPIEFEESEVVLNALREGNLNPADPEPFRTRQLHDQELLGSLAKEITFDLGIHELEKRYMKKLQEEYPEVINVEIALLR